MHWRKVPENSPKLWVTSWRVSWPSPFSILVELPLCKQWADLDTLSQSRIYRLSNNFFIELTHVSTGDGSMHLPLYVGRLNFLKLVRLVQGPCGGIWFHLERCRLIVSDSVGCSKIDTAATAIPSVAYWGGGVSSWLVCTTPACYAMNLLSFLIYSSWYQKASACLSTTPINTVI